MTVGLQVFMCPITSSMAERCRSSRLTHERPVKALKLSIVISLICKVERLVRPNCFARFVANPALIEIIAQSF